MRKVTECSWSILCGMKPIIISNTTRTKLEKHSLHDHMKVQMEALKDAVLQSTLDYGKHRKRLVIQMILNQMGENQKKDASSGTNLSCDHDHGNDDIHK